jgi:hypothetical protein
MFFFVSLPLIEGRQAERRPDHAKYARQVSALVSWFSRS